MGKSKVAVLVAEFLGTFALVSVVLAVVNSVSLPFFAAAAAATTLAVMVLVIGSISGSHINPAVTVGLWSINKIETSLAVGYIAAQMLAGYAAAVMYSWFTNTEVLTGGQPGGLDWRIAVAELIGTALFTFGIAAAVARAFDALQQAAAIGGALFIGILVASLGSAGAVNPAVALGANVWTLSYAVAPLLGGALGMNLYNYLYAVPVAKTRKK
jgi:glycerol uptake facilitator-like aquaporin